MCVAQRRAGGTKDIERSGFDRDPPKDAGWLGPSKVDGFEGLVFIDLLTRPDNNARMTMGEPACHSSQIQDWIALIRADGVGPRTFGRLIERFGCPTEALRATLDDLAAVEGIGLQTARRIVASRGRFDVGAELELADRLGVSIIHMDDPRYPAPLKKIPDPPPVLYVKGQLRPEHQLAVAIVGSRHCSLYGQEQASRLAYYLAAAGFTIVSGMARGIDTAAHQGALAAEGQTIAVQGCGLSRVFPPENARLFDLICRSGACISELPLQSEPLPEHFPARNRIIAGLCLATIIVEADIRSGAMITAKAALEYGREVMAVPGRVDWPLSKGPHRLIKDGAALLESPEDVLDLIGPVGQCMKGPLSKVTGPQDPRQGSIRLEGNERLIYDCLGDEPIHTDQIVAQTGLDAGQVISSLIRLQLKGLAKSLAGDMFIRR